MRSRLTHKTSTAFPLALLSILFCVIGTQAQSSSFTYQGRLTDGGTPADGPYDLQFKLYDGSGNPQGSPNTVTRPGVLVTSGGLHGATRFRHKRLSWRGSFSGHSRQETN